MNNILAVAGVVIKELYRRKDFYVLFILTVLICLVMASVNFFHDSHIIRYLKEICLLFIWICSLVIAITTTARQIPSERENRTLFPLLAKPLSRTQLLLGKFLGCWARLRPGADLLLSVLRRARRQPRASLAVAQLSPGGLAALGHAGGGHCVRPARLPGFCRALLERDDLLRLRRIHFGVGQAPQQGRVAIARAAPLDLVRALLLHSPSRTLRRAGSHHSQLAADCVAGVRRGRPVRLAYASALLIGACLVFRRKAIN